MGKPKQDSSLFPTDEPRSRSSTALLQSRSSVSLQDTTPVPSPGATATPPLQRYFDDDDDEDDELPPLYSDIQHTEGASVSGSSSNVNPLLPRGTPALNIEPFHATSSSSRNGTTYYIDKRLDNDPDFLEQQLNILAVHPPRPFVHIRGSHTETRQGDCSSSGETRSSSSDRSEEVVDFELDIELTYLLFPGNAASSRSRSSNIPTRTPSTVDNFAKVRRGTAFATRAPGFGGSGRDIEQGNPGVTEWCHRFCASTAGLKVFTLERRVDGWDFDLVKSKVEELIRNTGYKGHLRVTFPVHDARVDIYNECRASRWRLTRWIQVVFAISLLFVFTWPYLWLRTKRWETVYVSWPLSSTAVVESGNQQHGQGQGQRQGQGQGQQAKRKRETRYTSMSELQWYNMWARTIKEAVLQRRRGTLDQGDVRRTDRGENQGVVQAGMDAMGLVNQAFGWGGDSAGSFARRSGIRLGRR